MKLLLLIILIITLQVAIGNQDEKILLDDEVQLDNEILLDNRVLTNEVAYEDRAYTVIFDNYQLNMDKLLRKTPRRCSFLREDAKESLRDPTIEKSIELIKIAEICDKEDGEDPFRYCNSREVHEILKRESKKYYKYWQYCMPFDTIPCQTEANSFYDCIGVSNQTLSINDLTEATECGKKEVIYKGHPLYQEYNESIFSFNRTNDNCKEKKNCKYQNMLIRIKKFLEEKVSSESKFKQYFLCTFQNRPLSEIPYSKPSKIASVYDVEIASSFSWYLQFTFLIWSILLM